AQTPGGGARNPLHPIRPRKRRGICSRWPLMVVFAGRRAITGIKHAPRGEAQVKIRFDWPKIYSSVLARTAAQPKLAETTSQLIERDIAIYGAEPGEMFGTSCEICERYGIGRETLLQAVRLLEQRGVAKMRRGPRGGLIIIGRAGSNTVADLCSYFHQIGMTAEQAAE